MMVHIDSVKRDLLVGIDHTSENAKREMSR